MKTLLLFTSAAFAELIGCYLVLAWLRKGAPAWIVVPAAVSLGVFAWLLTLHPTASGRIYAAYGGVYVAMAILWLWLVDGVRPGRWDFAGAAVTLAGMAIIMFAPRPPSNANVPDRMPEYRDAIASPSGAKDRVPERTSSRHMDLPW